MKLNHGMRIFTLLLSWAAVWILAGAAEAQSGPLQYYAISPCRVVDTRNANSVNGGPILSSGVTRNFAVRGNCGVPTTAKAVTMNVTVNQPSAPSHLTLWPSGGTMPTVSTINFTNADGALANGAIVPLSTATQDLSAASCCANVHLILDVTGYFQ